MKKISLEIQGMHCASCALNLERGFRKEEGVSSVNVNYATRKAVLEYDENKLGEENLHSVVLQSGYRVKGAEGEDAEDKSMRADKLKLIATIIFTIPLFVRMFYMWTVSGNIAGIEATAFIQFVLATVVVLYFGRNFHINAGKQLIRRQFNMDSLISLGTLTALIYSTVIMMVGGDLYFETAAIITSLIMLGKYLEEKSKSRASQAMRKLLELGVKEARVLVNGKEEMKNIDALQVGDTLIVKAGEKIPLDGMVDDGQANLDESMLTGESVPVYKEKGADVFGATINMDGVIRVRVTKKSEDTILAQIIRTVEDAQSNKAPIQKLADKIAGIFVPIVITIAVITFFGWWLIGGQFSVGIIAAVVVLIISCPCALGIATPLAVMVGTSVGARNGILIKGGESFEKAKKIDTILFDKTGTLTLGEPKVQKIITVNETDFPEGKIMKISASLAGHSEHPLSRAVSQEAGERKVELADFTDFHEYSGRGLSAKCKTHGIDVAMGNLRLMQELKFDTAWAEATLRSEKGATLLFVAHGDRVIGAVALADELKASSAEAIAMATSLGIEPVIISGDNKYSVEKVAKELGITNYFAEVLPSQKAEKVLELQKQGKKVVFVGDGINDAPSLIQSDLGIAMGSGTDIAKEAGEIIITRSDPVKAVMAIKLSRQTFATIKQNLFWAFFYNVLAIPLAIMGKIEPMYGALAMSFSSIFVVLNSMRIYRFRSRAK